MRGVCVCVEFVSDASAFVRLVESMLGATVPHKTQIINFIRLDIGN